MNGFTTIITIVLVLLATSYMYGNGKKPGPAVYTPEGMRLLQNRRVGVVMLVILWAIAAFFLFFGVLCWQDIGLGQGGVVLLFFGMGVFFILLGLLARWLSDRNRVCFDDKRVIRYRAVGKPVEMEWWEVVEYSCNPQRVFLASADRRKIRVDATFSGLPELVEMIQEKVAGR